MYLRKFQGDLQPLHPSGVRHWCLEWFSVLWILWVFSTIRNAASRWRLQGLFGAQTGNKRKHHVLLAILIIDYLRVTNSFSCAGFVVNFNSSKQRLLLQKICFMKRRVRWKMKIAFNTLDCNLRTLVTISTLWNDLLSWENDSSIAKNLCNGKYKDEFNYQLKDDKRASQ